MMEKFLLILSLNLFSIILYSIYEDKKLFDINNLKQKYKKYPFENKLAIVIFLLGLIFGLLTKVYILIPGILILSVILPSLLLKKRNEKVKEIKMQQWLYFLDNMASATKAGFPIKESLVQALNSTELPLKNDLYSAIIEINRSNQVSKVIPILKQNVTDDIGKNVIKIIELVHSIGASDLTRILSILSSSSREFHDLIIELKTKQTWVLNGGKIAIAAPWVVLLALWTQENVRNSYQSLNGQIVLFLVALLGLTGFLVMQKIGNLELRRF